MGYSRIKLPVPAAYHITSRIKNDDFLLEDDEDKHALLDIIRRTAEFAGVTVMSHAILDNHFHILVRIPEREEVGDAELERRVRILWGAEKAEERFERWRFWEARGKAELAEKERNAFRRRMHDLTPFVKTVKELFTHSYNRRHNTSGPVWGRLRYKSAAVAQDFKTLAVVASYIDLNAVRARIVRHPKSYKWCGLGAAKKGDASALAGIAAMSCAMPRTAQNRADGMRPEDGMMPGDCKNAFDEYLVFLDGTKAVAKKSTLQGARKTGAADKTNGVCAGERAGGCARKTLDSVDLTRLGAEGVAQWLANSEIQPESLSEMWTRRFVNFAAGGILGPIALVMDSRDAIAGGAQMRRWSPAGLFDGVCSFISARNEKARKRNAS
jgi:Transposase and inactivated derivatives